MTKFNKSSLEEQAASFLRDQILTGTYKMGEKIVESSLAKELELSRSTIRMALNTLFHEGLVIQKPYVGWQVIEINETDIWEIYHLRIAIETRASWLAATSINDEGKKQLTELMRDFITSAKSEQVTTQKLSKFELELHSLIVELSQNERLIRIYRNVSNQMFLFFNIDLAAYDPLSIAQAHQPLIDAICSGQPDEAAQHAEKHLSTCKEVSDQFRAQQK